MCSSAGTPIGEPDRDGDRHPPRERGERGEDEPGAHHELQRPAQATRPALGSRSAARGRARARSAATSRAARASARRTPIATRSCWRSRRRPAARSARAGSTSWRAARARAAAAGPGRSWRPCRARARRGRRLPLPCRNCPTSTTASPAPWPATSSPIENNGEHGHEHRLRAEPIDGPSDHRDRRDRGEARGREHEPVELHHAEVACGRRA